MTFHRSRPVDPVSPSTGKSPTVFDTPKLKASCNTCAASKVKCTKERPVCSRCAKRGENCIYLASKRAGRVARPKSRSCRDVQQVDQSQNESDGGKEPSLCPSSPTVRDNGHSPASPIHMVLPQDYLTSSNMLSMPESFSTFPTSVDMLGDCGMDDFFASLNEEAKLNGLLTPLNDELGLGQFFAPITETPEGICDIFDPISLCGQTYSAVADPLSARTGISDPFFNPPKSISGLYGAMTEDTEAALTDTSPSNPNPHLHNEEILPSGQKCDCLTTSANLLTRLFTDVDSTLRSPMTHKTTPTNASQPSEVEVIISKNEECTELIRTMLRCQCAYNSYILSLLAMVVLKVLARYAATVRCNSVVPADDQMTESDNSRSDMEQRGPATVARNHAILGIPDSRRMTAQLVISQLHRVQGLINQIARRFAQIRQSIDQRRSNNGSTEAANSDDEDAEMNTGSNNSLDSPFSHDTLDQLESDLRQRLRNVWLEMKSIVLEE